MKARHNEPLEDWEYPDEDDISDEDLYDLKICQNCGEEIFEDADRCNHCGHWQKNKASSWRNSDKFYIKIGSWAVKTLTINWIFWIIASGIAAIAVWMRWLRH